MVVRSKIYLNRLLFYNSSAYLQMYCLKKSLINIFSFSDVNSFSCLTWENFIDIFSHPTVTGMTQLNVLRTWTWMHSSQHLQPTTLLIRDPSRVNFFFPKIFRRTPPEDGFYIWTYSKRVDSTCLNDLLVQISHVNVKLAIKIEKNWMKAEHAQLSYN